MLLIQNWIFSILGRLLLLGELAEQATLLLELVEAALFRECARLQNEDLVASLDGRHTMRDDDRRPVLAGLLECQLHFLLRVLVQRGRRFVEHEDLWLTDHSPGDGDTLLLATGKLVALEAADRLESLMEHDASCLGLGPRVDVTLVIGELALVLFGIFHLLQRLNGLVVLVDFFLVTVSLFQNFFLCFLILL